jgi:hypothetical protein
MHSKGDGGVKGSGQCATGIVGCRPGCGLVRITDGYSVLRDRGEALAVERWDDRRGRRASIRQRGRCRLQMRLLPYRVVRCCRCLSIGRSLPRCSTCRKVRRASPTRHCLEQGMVWGPKPQCSIGRTCARRLIKSTEWLCLGLSVRLTVCAKFANCLIKNK